MEQLLDVSVILFYREDRGWLDEARASVEAQSFNGNMELVEIHGNRSTSANLNEGIRQAKSRYVKYLCDDDLLVPHSLQKLFDEISKGFDVVCAGAINFNEHTGETSVYYSQVPQTVFELADLNTIHGGTTMYRRDALLQIGLFNESLKYGEEYDLHLRMAAAGMRFGCVDEIVYMYRVHDQMKSMQAKVNDGDAYIARKREIINSIQSKYFGSQQPIKK